MDNEGIPLEVSDEAFLQVLGELVQAHEQQEVAQMLREIDQVCDRQEVEREWRNSWRA
jgi:hypothetical protein